MAFSFKYFQILENFKHIFSPGKILLTSEYFVLDGALALAIPTKLGQDFYYKEIEDGKGLVFWEAFHKDKFWLKTVINYQNWEILETNFPESATFILKVLKNVQTLSSKKFQGNSSYYFKTNLQFPPNFGLGSSSTLMNNLAEFAEIDAFVLNEMSLGGSGYDIAVAQEKSAILYQNNPFNVEKVDFSPSFLDDLIFVHLNQKQDSREGIKLYKSKEKSNKLISEFSDLTRKILYAKSIEEFSSLIELHENKMSDFLNIKKVKEKYFENCPVFVKSLGAWGGDFVLSAKFGDYKNYFFSRGFHTIIEYKNLIY